MNHVQLNRDAWSGWSESYYEPGRRAWAKHEVDWGIWSVPEREVNALPPADELVGKRSIELGCGTGYFSAWLARRGMNAVGLDVTPAQLQSARLFQKEFDLEFPLIEGSAEDVPLASASFDLAISEYGASIWCDPYKWVPEAARLLVSGGYLVFLRNSTISMLTAKDVDPNGPELMRDYFDMYRFTWPEGGVEFHLPTGPMLRLLRSCGFELEDFIEIQAPDGEPNTRFDYMTRDWARRWPSEEIWRLRKN